MTAISKQAGEIPAPYGFVGSSVGRKVFMAVTGFVWIGFVFGHMLGNLQMFIGPDAINGYAEALHHLGPILWMVRILIACFLIIHIWTGIQLWLANRRARRVPYQTQKYQTSSLAGRTMIFSGCFVIGFVVFHLLHFTLRWTHPEYANLTDAQGRFDVHTMVITGFQSFSISATYVLAMFFLALHLSHAVFSLFQTLGWNSPELDPKLKAVANFASAVVFLGYVSIPLGVVFHVIEQGGTP